MDELVSTPIICYTSLETIDRSGCTNVWTEGYFVQNPIQLSTSPFFHFLRGTRNPMGRSCKMAS